MFFIAICNSEYRYNGLPDALPNARPLRRSRGVRDTPDGCWPVPRSPVHPPDGLPSAAVR